MDQANIVDNERVGPPCFGHPDRCNTYLKPFCSRRVVCDLADQKGMLDFLRYLIASGRVGGPNDGTKERA